jgi:hypothetical protein
MKAFVYAPLFLLVLLHATPAAAQGPGPLRFPWVYVVQHFDHQGLLLERELQASDDSTNIYDRALELSVNAVNGTSYVSRLRIHAFDSLAHLVYSVKDQIGPGVAREEFEWISENTFPKFNTRTVVISSEQPLYVDAVAVYDARSYEDDGSKWLDRHAKRSVPVKEVNCAVEGTRYGWFCGVANLYPLP